MLRYSVRLLRVAILVLAFASSGCTSATDEPARRSGGALGFGVVEATIADLQSAIKDGKLTCADVVQMYLDRIAVYDSSTGVNAITVVNPNALGRADEIDAALAKGEQVGPLFCAPILVKDNFDTHDLPTTGGSITLLGSQPPDDAFMVRRLREADAIVLAKTNMAEWAFSPRRTVSSSYGTTANAYDVSRVPAGSSGGTASGVAASFGVAGLGSDTGNSIRGPSSHLALFGIRSTIGLTSRDGVIPLSYDRDIAGPMTRTVEDGARIFDVIAGYDPADPITEEGRGLRESDYTSRLRKDGLLGARIGIVRELVDPQETDKEIVALFELAIDDLRNAGATIVDPFVFPEMGEHLAADNYCPRFRYDMKQYLASLGDEAPISDVKEAYDSGRFAAYAKPMFDFYMEYPGDRPPEMWDPPCPTYLEHPGRREFHDALLGAMNANDVNAIVYPSWTSIPAPLDRAREEYRGDNSQLIAPDTGMPAVTIPMGFTRDKWPAGLQFVARRFEDGLLIQYAYAFEQSTQHRRPPSGFPPIQNE
ncbi:MAG: amidase [Rhodothermia bacterium]|nr:amidase [Rhodothermia bacterium]